MMFYFRIDCSLTTGFKNYVAYVTSHKAVVRERKGVKGD